MEYIKKLGVATPSLKPPVTAAEVPAEWCHEVGKIVRRDGHAVRLAGDTAIEVKSLTTNNWHPLGLPTGATTFTSKEDRDLVMGKIMHP